MGETNYTYQYDRPPMPANWTDAERRFYVKLMDVLDDIYLRYGRIDEKLLSPKVVGRIADTEGNVSSVTQTANNLNAQINGANGIAAKLDLVPGQITAAVGAIDDSGVNLIPHTGWYTEIGLGWTFTDNTGAWIKYPASSLNRSSVDPDSNGATFGGNGFVHWNNPTPTYGSMYSKGIQCVAGEEYTLSFRYRGSGLSITFIYYYSDNTSTMAFHDYTAGHFQKDYSITVTAPEGAIKMQVVFQCHVGTIGVLGRIKLERGDKATQWSLAPEDPAEGIEVGTSIVMNKNRIVFNGPEIDVNTSGSNGDTRWDNEGMTVPVINSPSVVPRYTGPASITVNPSATPTDDSVFRTLTEAFAALSNKWLDKSVVISMAGNTAEDIAYLRGVYGPGGIEVDGNSYTVGGRLNFFNVGVGVWVHALKVTYAYTGLSLGYLVSGTGVSRVVFDGCALNGAGTQYDCNGFELSSGAFRLNGCSISNVRYPITSKDRGARLHVDNCSGTGYYGLNAIDGGYISYNTENSATYPHGTQQDLHEARGGHIHGATGSSSGGTTPTPVTPVTTATETLTAAASNTYQASGSGWLGVSDRLYQGLSAGYVHYAAIAFPISGQNINWYGKTIHEDGTLTIRRYSNDGKGGAINVKMKTFTAAPGSGNPASSGSVHDWGLVGTVPYSGTGTLTIPKDALQGLSDGTYKSLVFYDDGGAWGGRSISENYAEFYGSGASSNKPTLTVTYEVT